MDAKPDSGAKELPNGRFDVPATAEADPYPSAVHPGNVLHVLFADQNNVAS